MSRKEGTILGKEAPMIDETIEVSDAETTDDLPVEEQGSDTPTSPDENDDTAPQTQTRKDVVSFPDAEVLVSVNQRLSTLQELFETQIARNQNQRQMFDAIYGEMKDYKENVLLEASHKPIIHNLIQFYDHFVEVESQLNRISKPFETFETWSNSVSDGLFKKIRPAELADELLDFRRNLKEELSQFWTNLKNLRFALEEVLYRLDVTPYEEHPKKLDRKLHKTFATIPTDDPDKDQEVAEIHKIGFYWREKVFRPEEVTIFRYTHPIDEETEGGKLTDEKGDEIDE